MKYLIGIDALGIDRPGGARTAVFYLLQVIFETAKEISFIVYVSKFEDDFSRFKNVKQKIVPVRKGLFSRLIAQFYFFHESVRYNFDLFHFTKSQGAFLFRTKSIITIFDLTILREPEMFSPIDVFYWKKIQPLLLSKMEKIIAISNDVVNDLEYFYGVNEKNIDVVNCSTQFDGFIINKNINNSSEIKEKYGLPDKYLLFLGIIAQKKNLVTLIKAIKILKNSKEEIPVLILAGPYYPKSDGSEVLKFIETEDLSENVKYIGMVDVNDLSELYKSSIIFILPSIHEGFGIPVLEAMQHHVPVIVSDTSSLPEVVGDAGYKVKDFMNPSEWAKAIQLLLNNQQIRDDLILEGESQIKKFSWKMSAEKTIMIYNKVLENKK